MMMMVMIIMIMIMIMIIIIRYNVSKMLQTNVFKVDFLKTTDRNSTIFQNFLTFGRKAEK